MNLEILVTSVKKKCGNYNECNVSNKDCNKIIIMLLNRIYFKVGISATKKTKQFVEFLWMDSPYIIMLINQESNYSKGILMHQCSISERKAWHLLIQ